MTGWTTLSCGCVVALTMAILTARADLHQSPPKKAVEATGWTIPEGAANEKNPFEPTPQNLTSGEKLFAKNCMRCHGVSGRGDGPDADPDHKPEDLTDSKRAARNPDGVMFHKVWNGRKKPEMPTFKSKLTKDEVWKVILYAKSLRKPAAPTK